MLRSIFLSLIVCGLSACAAENLTGNDPGIGAAPPVISSPEPAKGAPRITFTDCHVEGPFIAITFDDGPNPPTTTRLLKMLRERGIKATFFCVGQNVAQAPEIAQQIVAEGHEIANHSWSHPLLTKMSEPAVRDQIDRTHNVIRQTTGVTPTLLRPPFGGFTLRQRAWANAEWNYKIILWDVDSLDWKHRSPAKTQSIILAETKKGSIILCHDIHKPTVDAMPSTLDALLAKGFKFVTVTELLKMHHEAAPQKKGAVAKAGAVKEAESANAASEDLRPPPPKSVGGASSRR